MAIALTPCLLFALAAIPRLWASDVAPFGARQATELSTAHHSASGVAWAYWLIGTAPVGLATQARALLVELPDSSRNWMVMLGLFDATTTILIFLAARRSVGIRGATLAATLYAVSPWAWVLARDPAPLALPVLGAAALLAAVDFVHEPRAGRAALLGLCGALVVRTDPVGWVYLLPLVATSILARPTRRAFSAGALTFAALGGPTVLRGLGIVDPGDADPMRTIEGFLWLVSGRASIEPWPVGWPSVLGHIQMFALACGGGLLAVGAALALGADGRRTRGRLVLLAWAALPLATVAFTHTEPGVGPLATLLPATTALMALPLVVRGGRYAATIRRAALAGGIVVVGASALTLGMLLRQVASTEAAPATVASISAARTGDGRALPRLEGGATATLRFWQAIADAALDAAERTGAGELSVMAGPASPDDSRAILASLLEGRLAVRSLPADVVALPIDREALYLLLPGSPTPPALSWPSARLATVALPDADGSARLISLRPRPVAQWLAGRSARGARFADGTALVGARSAGGTDGPGIELHWTFEPEMGARDARAAELHWPGDDRETGTLRVELPAPDLRRSGELVVQRVNIATWPNGHPGFGTEDPAVFLEDAVGRRVPAR